MKVPILRLAAFLIAFTLAYAFKPAPGSTMQIKFELASHLADPFNPASYIVSSVNPNNTLCPGESRVCLLIIPLTDLHVSGIYLGLPKVDDFGVGALGTDLDSVLNQGFFTNPTNVHGRTIWERN